MGSLAIVLILSAIAGLIGYSTFDATSLESSVQAKSTMCASNLTSHLGETLEDLVQYAAPFVEPP